MIMSEQTIPIPGRLKNVAIGGHVTGSEDIDAGGNKTQKQVNDETNDTLALHQSEISGLNSQNYVSVSAYSSLPATGSADTIYRVSSWDGNANSGEGATDVTKYTEYAWNGTAYIVVSVKTQIGEVFDISEYKAVGGTLATFENLSAALDSGNNVPAGIRKGGMSVKFVQSSDNKYIQARCMAQNFTTDTTQWAISDEGVYVENPEFVYVKTDAEGKILFGIKIDGEPFFGVGCPKQVKEYVEEKIAELSLDEYEDIVTFLGDYLGSDTTLKVMIDGINATKLDKEGLDPEALGTITVVENPEYIQITTDSEDKILEGIKVDGVKQVNLPIDTPSVSINHIDNPEWSEIKTDNKQNIIEGVKKNGLKHVSQFDKETLIKLNEDLTPLRNYRKIYPHNAIVSFIDDDTGAYIPDIWGEIIEETGIKMGFACIAGFMSGEITPTSPAYIQLPLEDLRTLYDNGHEVYSHSWSHHSFRISSFERLETECQKSKDWLDANGFTRNSDIIVYPGGMGEKKIDEQTVIRRFYHYGVDTDTSDFGVNPEPVNEQCICRCNGDSLSLAELKARVDLAVERKHLLVIMCHAYELMHFEGVTPPSTSIGTKEQNIQRLIDLINYIKSLNIEILPVGEALHQIYGW